MTAPNPTQTTCPECQSIYVTALETGNFFCAECRHEWDPLTPPVVTEPAPPIVGETETVGALAAGADPGEVFTTWVDVDHDDGGSGNRRTDTYTYMTDFPHTLGEAEAAAFEHYRTDVGSHVFGGFAVRSVPEIDNDPDPWDDEHETATEAHDRETETADAMGASMDDALDALDTPEATRALAEAYLETLIGTGVTLEGGQRATLVDFPDDDHALVRLADGSDVIVDFNDIVRADDGPRADELATVEIDDGTAEMFGTATLNMACLVIEAGIASIDMTGPVPVLKEPPSGWFLPDEQAIPLMEQAAAAAVAMLIQTFALPVDVLAAAVDKVRKGTAEMMATEETE